jgi:hypothetical protein
MVINHVRCQKDAQAIYHPPCLQTGPSYPERGQQDLNATTPGGNGRLHSDHEGSATTSAALQELPSQSGNGVADHEVEISDDVTPTQSDPDEIKRKKIAGKLIKKVITGMERIAGKADHPSDNSQIQCMITKTQLNDQPKQTLENLKESLMTSASISREVGTYNAWMNEYNAGCIYLFFRKKGHYSPGEGGAKMRQVATWVRIIHKMLTRLLVTEGIIAFAIIFAYAGRSKQVPTSQEADQCRNELPPDTR